MYNLNSLYTCLKDVVGFEQTSDPTLPVLDADLIITESGQTFQQEHPLVDMGILHSVATEFAAYQYTAYNAATLYAQGERMRYLEVNYEWTNAAPSAGGITPPHADWAVVDEFNPFLRNMRLQAIGKVLSAYRTNKQLKEITKSQLDRIKLFDSAGRMTDKEIRKSRFVGLEIVPDRSEGLLMTIHRLGTQFDAIQTSKTFYVYHSSQIDHCFSIVLDINKANGFEWHNIFDAQQNTLDLFYSDEAYEAGGRWFIGYYEDDFTGQAIIKKFDWEKGPCNSCSGSDYRKYQSWSKWVGIRPFYVNSNDLNGTDLWDVEKNIYPSQTNFGLNLDISIKCDITDIFCTQRSSLADAISKQFAVDLAEEIVYSSRLNRIEERQRKNAMIALDTDANGNPGLSVKLKKSIESLEFDFSALGSVCLPCNEGAGIRWGSI